MFMNNTKEIKEWLSKHTDLSNYDINKFTFIEKENYIEINYYETTGLSFSFYQNNNNYDRFFIEELPIKFGIINCTLSITNLDLNSFKGFPDIINGNFGFNDSNLKSISNWNIKEINGSINLCGPNCELDNLNFLENTKFEEIYLRIANTPFKNDIIPNDYQNSIKTKSYNEIIEYKDLIKVIKLSKISENDVDNYLNSFDKELEKDKN